MNLTIPSSRLEPYVSGANLFAALAFPPTASSDRKFRDAVDCLCRLALMARFAARPGLERTPLTVTPAFLMIPPLQAQRLEAEIRKRLHERMAAAHATMPFFKEAERIAAGAPASTRRKLNVDNEATRTTMAEADRASWLQEQGLPIDRHFPEDPNNFDNRWIVPSLPVIHIAATVAIVMDRRQKELRSEPAAVRDEYPRDMQGPQLSLALFLEEPDLVAQVIETAAALEQLIPHLQLPRLRSQAEELIHLELE